MGAVRPLEDLLRQRMRGPMGPRAVLTLIGAALAALLLLIATFSSWYTVPTDSKAVVKRFGRVVAVTDPGLHFKLPFGVETATIVQTERVLKTEFGFRSEPSLQSGRTRYDKADFLAESLMLTGDLNVVDVEWVVQYSLVDPDRWLHASRDPVDTIRDIAESVMRREVGNTIGSRVLTIGRVELAANVAAEMQRTLDQYRLGVKIKAVELQDVAPPDPVKPAFNEVNEARQERERAVNVAEKERNEVLPRARGEAQQTISEAQAYAMERVNEAKGAASRFSALLAEYRKSVEVTRRRLFLEEIDDVLPRVRSLVVVDPKVGGPLPLLNLDAAANRTGGER